MEVLPHRVSIRFLIRKKTEREGKGKHHFMDGEISVRGVAKTVCRSFAIADIINQVNIRIDAKTVLETGVGPCVAPGLRPRFLRHHAVEETRPVFTLSGGGQEIAHASLRFHFRPVVHPVVEMMPSPPPSRPAPDVIVAAEEVAVRAASDSILEVVASNVNDTFVVAVALQHLLAESEKARMGDAVVFEDYRFLDLPKDPVEAGGDAAPAAEIGFGIIGDEIASFGQGVGDE